MADDTPTPPSDNDRERAAEAAQRSRGDGRLTLEEFSVRVGSVWSAETGEELARATADLASAPIVGSGQTVDSILNVLRESKRTGRWRLRTPRLWLRTFFGSTELDLREMITDQRVVEIGG